MESAPPPPIEWLRDTSPADWVCERLGAAAHGVASIIPDGYEAYARIAHAAEGVGTALGSLPLSQREPLVALLGESLPRSPLCWFCIWEGFGDLDHQGVAERVELPMRRYFLCCGPLRTALASLPTAAPPPRARSVSYSREVIERWRRSASPPPSALLRWPASRQSPNLWWPEDRSWFVATEIDAAYTYVGGPRPLIEDLLAHPLLAALPAQSPDA